MSNKDQTWSVTSSGITLRDYFAAKAMAALIVARGSEIIERGWPSYAEVDAYYIADAMLRAREEGEPK